MVLEYIEQNKSEIKKFTQTAFKVKKQYQKQEYLNVYKKLKLIGTEESLDRGKVLEYFNNDIKCGFVAAMIWGGINAARTRGTGNLLNTNFGNFLNDINIDNKVEDIVEKINAVLNKDFNENGLMNLYIEFKSNNKYKLSGIGPAYYTKLFFFISQLHQCDKKLLIFDKWTIRLYAAYLLENDKKKLDIFYNLGKLKSLALSSDINPLYSSMEHKAYANYILDFNKIANDFKVPLTNLEGFLFGYPLRSGNRESNPRVLINNYILKETASMQEI